MELNEQQLQRRDSLDKIIALGIDPYPGELWNNSTTAKDIIANFTEFENKEVIIAGRIMRRRIMGKASFAYIQDSEIGIQIYINRDDICPSEDKTYYNTFFKKLLDIGDIIGVKGKVFKTQTGEISIHVFELKLLAKSLTPLPLPKEKDGEIYDAFTDPEQRYRMRYVDLIVNKDRKSTFIKRSQTIQFIREYLLEMGYLEVETPILQPIPGGAAAKPFITHHNTLDIDLYLRIANELYLKRLIVGGYDAVFEFAKDFRNEGMDKTHNPEFTVMELYVAYKDYYWMMDMVEDMLRKICNKVTGNSLIQYGNKTIDFEKPFERLSLLDAIEKYSGIRIHDMEEDELFETAKSLNLDVDKTMGKGKLIDEIFGETVEHHLINPTFIIDYPIEMSPLTKKHRYNPKLTERYELIINGKEIANCYTELNDPIDQRERFENQLKLMDRGDEEAMYIDQDFLNALEYGMPPTAGVGIGIDRLVMLLTGEESIQEVLFFPQMRPLKSQKNSH